MTSATRYHPRVPVCLTADIEFEIRGALGKPQLCKPVGAESVLRPVQRGRGGLEALLDPLVRHALPATFFIEVMQSIHFGLRPMRRVLDQCAASPLVEFQMHIHPCWRYLAGENWRQTVAEAGAKQDSMAGLGVPGAKEVLSLGMDLFKNLTGTAPVAFRSGSLKVDFDLMLAQEELGIRLSSCVGHAYSPSTDPRFSIWSGIERFGSVTEIPVTSYQILAGRRVRPKLLTLTGTPLPIVKRILRDAWERRSGPVVLLTHTSEMAVDTTDIFSPPRYAALQGNQERWRGLCAHLDENRDRYDVLPMGGAIGYWDSLPAISHPPYRGGFRDLSAFTVSHIQGRVGALHAKNVPLFLRSPVRTSE